jgi:fructose-1,6-bisphosphatase
VSTKERAECEPVLLLMVALLFFMSVLLPSPLITYIISFHRATTVLVLTLGSGVHGFTLDPDKQTFLQTHPNMRIPDVGSLYSFNEANSREFSEPVQQFLEKMKESGKIG